MTLVLEDEHVAQLLPMADCIDAMETAFRDFAIPANSLPVRALMDTKAAPICRSAMNHHIQIGQVGRLLQRAHRTDNLLHRL